MRKRELTILAVVLALALVLTGCGAAPAPSATPEATPTETVKPTESAKPTETPEPTETPAPTVAPTIAPTVAPTVAPTAPPAPVATRDAAVACIGSDVSVLYAAVGYPLSSDYAQSCLGPGEDGELHYADFVVYTYRENGVETVTDVA